MGRWPGLPHDRPPWLFVFLAAAGVAAWVVHRLLTRRIGPRLRRSRRSAVGLVVAAAALGALSVAAAWRGPGVASTCTPSPPRTSPTSGASRRRSRPTCTGSGAG